MAIETTYRTLLTEDYIKDQLSRGVTVTAQDVEDEVTALLEDKDLSQPQFESGTYTVARLEESSASGFRNTFLAVRQDVRVLYKELLRLADISQRAFERWGLESDSIEKKLIDLEERIENLLLLTQDTEGYHSVLVDNFTDTEFTDVTNTSAEVDLASKTVEMGISTTAGGEARIFLNDINLIEDVTFKVRSTVDQVSRVDQVNADLTNPFHQESKTWWTSVNMKSRKPVTCELTVRLSPDGPVNLSRIFMELHDSAESSPMFITPLYSADNTSFSQLPTNTFTVEGRTTAVFSFSQVSAKWIKFIITKEGPDPSSSNDIFSYQFGFKSIEFFQQAFDISTPGTWISSPLFVVDGENNVKEFEKLTLETCERVEDNTAIEYSITVSNDPTVPLDSTLEPTGGTWVPISPVQRTEQLHPNILNVGDVVATDIGDTELDTVDSEIVTISYDGRATDSDFVAPAQAFNVLYRDPSTGNVLQEARSSTTIRYAFQNSNERMLNYQIKDSDSGLLDSGLNVDEEQLILFRNVGAKGFTPSDVVNLVRDTQRGWKFEEPYYKCVIEIQNPNGMTMDIGDQNIIIDDVTYSNVIDSSVLTGQSGILGSSDRNTGVHTVQVHKNNWKEVTPDLNSLADLQAADILYPFNHKLLIEGYAYGATYPDTDERTYTGADLFAESAPTRISIFDMVNNISSSDYDFYALDRDAPKSHSTPNTNNDPTRVFVVKTDEANPDFQNERFVIRFNLVNELRQYLRLRATLSTESAEVTPALHSYKMKLG